VFGAASDGVVVELGAVVIRGKMRKYGNPGNSARYKFLFYFLDIRDESGSPKPIIGSV
jgi:hypothetical protein